ncbi:MAG: hypothetical protein JWM41_213 [Gemmatimonadetes bacterium]|nr:hypothetical protein [Gemmatimonadota bacterium]
MRHIAFVVLFVHAGATLVAADAQTPPAARHREVTPELERSAFADPAAQMILERARAARLAQDSALHGYDAKTFLRFSIGMRVSSIGPQRLMLRTEQAARVRWTSAAGLWVEPTARRTAFPMGEADLDLTEATPIPYFPGRESLWIPSGKMRVVQAEVNEDQMIHPLAAGAEAYYRYASGDSITIRLTDGRAIALRELRITARRPEWRSFVGSFWFDVDRGSLVRAAYRMSADLDVWQMANEDTKRKLRDWEEKARTDTGAAAQRARREVERLHVGTFDKLKTKMVEGLFSPVRANLSAVTVEYGLYEGRFWLPKLNVAEGEVQGGFMHMPMTWQESFKYNSVNGADSMPAIPTTAVTRLVGDDTTWATMGRVTIGGSEPTDTSLAARTAREDSLMRGYNATADTLRASAQKLRAAGDTAGARRLARRALVYAGAAHQIIRRREGCVNDSTYYAGTSTRYGGRLRTAIRLPCDLSRLANSPDLPGSIYDSGEEIFGTVARDELLKSLDFSLQPGWAPQAPTLHAGLDLLRYNRIEGLSLGLSVTSTLGLGLTAQAVGRIGTADGVPNGELSVSRSNGRADLRVGVFHRLAVANDDWGAPLSFGASLANVLYARDEGFYYRSWGAELAGTRDAPGVLTGASLSWRAFAERQRTAGIEPNTHASLGNAFGHAGFVRNIDAAELTALGVGGELTRTFGIDPERANLFTRLRVEGAFTDGRDSIGMSGYGRLAGDATFTRGLGPLDAALTGAAGTSAGDLPAQRAFYVGGLQTVRGQFARPDGAGRVGDAFWLARVEVGPKSLAARPTLFYDVGWAGRRADFAQPGRPLSGAGVGLSLLDGLLKLDAARGIYPEKRWRFDLSLGARF